MQIDNSSIQFFTPPGYGKMSTAGTPRCSIPFFSVLRPDAGAGKQVFQPYEEPISKLTSSAGIPLPTGGYVSSGEENNVWGDTSGSHDYSEDCYPD